VTEGGFKLGVEGFPSMVNVEVIALVRSGNKDFFAAFVFSVIDVVALLRCGHVSFPVDI
jgi:hypothetical protein